MLVDQGVKAELFENPVVGVRILSVAEGGRILLANGTFQRMLGYSEAELLERTFSDVTHPDDREEGCDFFAQTVAGKLGSYQLEERYLCKDGSTFWGRLTAYPVLAPDGSPVRLVGLVEDVSERKAAEQKPLESAQRLEALLRSAVDAIVTIDPTGKILSVNPATEKMFGYAADELRGENVKILMPAPYRDEHDGYIARFRQTGEKRIIGVGREVEGRRKDGSTFPVDLAVSEVEVGTERIFMGTLRDLTDRKLLEASLLQSQKLEAIGRLAGGVSHDFNTLLGTITGYAEMMRDSASNDPTSLSPDQVCVFADKIHRAASRGADLTRQLLAFSRRQEVRPKRVDLAAMTNETGDMIRRLIGEDICFEHSVEHGLGAVSLDPGQLQQVLLNLAVNAADAMPRGGRLTMTWSRVRLDQETPTHGGTVKAGDYAELRVADTGHGMNEETIDKIFEPFFTTKEPGKGTGLGLSTVFGIVRQWRGGITVSSLPREGTTFRILFPEAEPDCDPSSCASIQRPSFEDRACGSTILLVEDDEMFRELVGEVLSSNGFRVLEAASPVEVAAFGEEKLSEVDVLVSDLVMPDGSGVDLAGSLRSHFPELKVILMSGYSDEARASRELDEHTADLFLEKPFSIGTLRDAIQQVTGGSER